MERRRDKINHALDEALDSFGARPTEALMQAVFLDDRNGRLDPDPVKNTAAITLGLIMLLEKRLLLSRSDVLNLLEHCT